MIGSDLFEIEKRKAVKHDQDKLRFELIPVRPLEELAKLYTVGAKKYADRNWENGFHWTRMLGACMRHLFAFCKGEDLDRESGCHHMACVAFYCFALIEFGSTCPELDDRGRLSTQNVEVTPLKTDDCFTGTKAENWSVDPFAKVDP